MSELRCMVTENEVNRRAKDEVAEPKASHTSRRQDSPAKGILRALREREVVVTKVSRMSWRWGSWDNRESYELKAG